MITCVGLLCYFSQSWLHSVIVHCEIFIHDLMPLARKVARQLPEGICTCFRRGADYSKFVAKLCTRHSNQISQAYSKAFAVGGILVFEGAPSMEADQAYTFAINT